jgi:hypothetical protein
VGDSPSSYIALLLLAAQLLLELALGLLCWLAFTGSGSDAEGASTAIFSLSSLLPLGIYIPTAREGSFLEVSSASEEMGMDSTAADGVGVGTCGTLASTNGCDELLDRAVLRCSNTACGAIRTGSGLFVCAVTSFSSFNSLLPLGMYSPFSLVLLTAADFDAIFPFWLLSFFSFLSTSSCSLLEARELDLALCVSSSIELSSLGYLFLDTAGALTAALALASSSSLLPLGM